MSLLLLFGGAGTGSPPPVVRARYPSWQIGVLTHTMRVFLLATLIIMLVVSR